MAYDEQLAGGIRRAIQNRKGLTEKKMFGGIAFLLQDHLFCGVVADKLMLRLGATGVAAVLKEQHVAAMDFAGKPMKTMVYVLPMGIKRDGQLDKWLVRALEFAETLPSNRKGSSEVITWHPCADKSKELNCTCRLRVG